VKKFGPLLILRVLTAILLSFVAAYPQTAQVQVSTGVLEEVSHEKIRSILQGMGIEFTEASQDRFSGFRLRLDGNDVTLENQPSSLQLARCFSGTSELKKVNDWNEKFRFGRAYINKDSNPCLKWDLSLEGGRSEASIGSFIKGFQVTLRSYNDFLANEGPTPRINTPTPLLMSFRKSSSATTKVKTHFGSFVLWVDSSKWKQDRSNSEETMEFVHVAGEAHVRVITERIGLPIDVIRNAVLATAQKGDTTTKITLEEKRLINGREVLAIGFESTSNQVRFVSLGYYYGGSSGTIQVVGYTVKSAFERNAGVFTEFLSGLEISDTPVPPSAERSEMSNSSSGPGLLSFNSGKMNLHYDESKWRQTPSPDPGRFLFRCVPGDGYALVVPERLDVPLESLLEIALSNAQKQDPNARIISKEQRKVNGVELWFLKLEVDAMKVPLTYYGYYYSGRSGTVQVLTFTGRKLIAEYEKDFMTFLNGLHIEE